MNTPSVHILRETCRIFLERAYPRGAETIPVARRAYCDIPTDALVDPYLDVDSVGRGICERLAKQHPGFSFRLGCEGFPFLKLTLQWIESAGWLCGVDTHDGWHHPDHPDADSWSKVQSANRELKSRIERAFEAAGFLTHNGLLRRELAAKKN